MKKQFFLALSLFACGFVLLFPRAGFSAVVVDSQFEGTLVITSAEGEINLVEPGDTIPPIANGSILEVFDGKFTVTTEEGDEITVSCLENEAAVSGAASVVLSCGENSGKISVVKGKASVTDDEGKSVTLNEGESYDIQMPVLSEASPTASGEELGLEFEDDFGTEPDSTSIEAQDSQTPPASPVS